MISLHDGSKISKTIGFNMPKELWVVFLFCSLHTQACTGMHCEADTGSLTFKKMLFGNFIYVYNVFWTNLLRLPPIQLLPYFCNFSFPLQQMEPTAEKPLVQNAAWWSWVLMDTSKKVLYQTSGNIAEKRRCRSKCQRTRELAVRLWHLVMPEALDYSL